MQYSLNAIILNTSLILCEVTLLSEMTTSSEHRCRYNYFLPIGLDTTLMHPSARGIVQTQLIHQISSQE